MGEKRSRIYDSFGNGNGRSGHQFFKPQKPHEYKHRPSSNSTHMRHAHSRDDPVFDYLSRLPEPKGCELCKHSAAELQNGLLSMLDKLIWEEKSGGDNGSKDMVHHAGELYRLLSARASHDPPYRAQQEIDRERPEKAAKILIPEYIEQKLERSKVLPPLPPIDEPYLEEAVFTHSTASKQSNARGLNHNETNYEKLEFLGDAYLEIIASRLIYSRFPDVETSQQSFLREQLVKNETLAGFSSAYGLGDRLKHGGHIMEQKGWTKILADVFEAYVAALVLSNPDTGFSTAEAWLTTLWAPQMLAYKVPVVENARARDDINKLLASPDVKPLYKQERDMQTVDGKQTFYMGLYLTGWGFKDEWLGSGEGQNKAQACVFAAMDALKNRMDIIEAANKRKLKKYPPKPKPTKMDGDVNEKSQDHKAKGGENVHADETLVEKKTKKKRDKGDDSSDDDRGKKKRKKCKD